MSDQKWAADPYHLPHSPFGTLSPSAYSFLRFIIRFPRTTQDLFYVKRLFRKTSSCTMSPRFSTCTLAMDSFQSLLALYSGVVTHLVEMFARVSDVENRASLRFSIFMFMAICSYPNIYCNFRSTDSSVRVCGTR